jgi:hypothetical protein
MHLRDFRRKVLYGMSQEIKKSGDTYSRAFGTTIGFESLTTVFGMGTGVAFRK